MCMVRYYLKKFDDMPNKRKSADTGNSLVLHWGFCGSSFLLDRGGRRFPDLHLLQTDRAGTLSRLWNFLCPSLHRTLYKSASQGQKSTSQVDTECTALAQYRVFLLDTSGTEHVPRSPKLSPHKICTRFGPLRSDRCPQGRQDSCV